MGQKESLEEKTHHIRNATVAMIQQHNETDCQPPGIHKMHTLEPYTHI